jgi:hypothetical protein
MNMCPLYVFKLVTTCVKVPLLSSSMATNELENGRKQRQNAQKAPHKRSLSEQTIACAEGHRYPIVIQTKSK